MQKEKVNEKILKQLEDLGYLQVDDVEGFIAFAEPGSHGSNHFKNTPDGLGHLQKWIARLSGATTAKPMFPSTVTAHVKYEKLDKSLEGITSPDDFFELVVKTTSKNRVISCLPPTLFPAVRIVFQDETFCIVRAYTGATTLKSQQHCIENLHLLNYECVKLRTL